MELKFVIREADHLVFETQKGERVRVVIDDSLREAIRRQEVSISQGVSPREVQTGLRAGKTLTEVALDLGVPERVIEPFAAPILDELRYVLDSALKTTLPSGKQMIRFQELVAQFYPSAQLRAFKSQERWIIEDSTNSSLSWFFDSKSRHLEPIGEEAKALSKNSETINQVVSNTQLRSVVPVSAAPGTAASLSVPPSQTVPFSQEQDPTPEGSGASIHDLVQQLRLRKTPEPTKPASAKGRAALPSWDEIVLGTSNLESNPDQRDS